MSNIEAPNYTQIPNVIFDYWANKLKPIEFMILLVLCRKIFGWHKTSDTISKNQIIKATGLSKNTVQVAIEGLESHGLVLKHQNKDEYGDKPNSYSLNTQKPIDEIYSEGQNLPPGGSNFDPGGGQTVTPGGGQTVTPQKKDITKERLTKEYVQTSSAIATESGPAKISSSKSKSDNLGSVVKNKFETKSTRDPLSKKDIYFCFDHQEFQNISPKDMKGFEEAYPLVNLKNEIARITQWNLANEQKAKMKKNWRKFINKWFQSTQDKLESQEAYRAAKNHSGQFGQTPGQAVVDVELIEERRGHVKKYISENWSRVKGIMEDKVMFVQIGNDKIYYDNPKFKDLSIHSLKKLNL